MIVFKLFTICNRSKESIIKAIIGLSVILLAACGGGSSSSTPNVSNSIGSNNNPGTENQESGPMNPNEFSAYFNNTRGETQTTDEFNEAQEEKLAEIAEARVLKEIDRHDYEADTGYATFRLEFGYKDNGSFKGPSYRILSSTTTLQSGSISVTSSRYIDMVFVNEAEEFSLTSNDSLYNCENSYLSEFSLYMTTMCEVDVMVDRDKLDDYNFHVELNVSVTTLEGYNNRTSLSVTSSITNIHLPMNRLNSISIIDKDTNTIFGTFYPL